VTTRRGLFGWLTAGALAPAVAKIDALLPVAVGVACTIQTQRQEFYVYSGGYSITGGVLTDDLTAIVGRTREIMLANTLNHAFSP